MQANGANPNSVGNEGTKRAEASPAQTTANKTDFDTLYPEYHKSPFLPWKRKYI